MCSSAETQGLETFKKNVDLENLRNHQQGPHYYQVSRLRPWEWREGSVWNPLPGDIVKEDSSQFPAIGHLFHIGSAGSRRWWETLVNLICHLDILKENMEPSLHSLLASEVEMTNVSPKGRKRSKGWRTREKKQGEDTFLAPNTKKLIWTPHYPRGHCLISS